MKQSDIEAELERIGLKVRVDTELKNELMDEDGLSLEEAEGLTVYVAINDTIYHLHGEGEDAMRLARMPGFLVDEDGDGYTAKPAAA